MKRLLRTCLALGIIATLITTPICSQASYKPFSVSKLEDTNRNITYFIKGDVIIRDGMSKYAKELYRMSYGDYIVGATYENKYNNTWINFKDNDGNNCFVYYGENIEEHTCHSWKASVSTEKGTVSVCECGFTEIRFSGVEEKSNFNFINWSLELVGGDVTEDDYVTAQILSVFVPDIPVVTDAKDAYDLAKSLKKGDYKHATLDLASLIPFTGNVKKAVNLACDADTIIEALNDVMSSHRTLDIDEALFEKFAAHFDLGDTTDELMLAPIRTLYEDVKKERLAGPVGDFINEYTLEEVLNVASSQEKDWVTARWIN